MPSSTPKLMVTLGVVGLVHAAISAAQHRSYLRLTEQSLHYPSTGHHLPERDVSPCDHRTASICRTPGNFKEVPGPTGRNLENKSFETFGNRPSFYTFCHRGRSVRLGVKAVATRFAAVGGWVFDPGSLLLSFVELYSVSLYK
uniref:Putative conserved secreted protein n=1 Tax=Ixodes ricinus TaxID=34613 RepID=V5GK31_IXORI